MRTLRPAVPFVLLAALFTACDEGAPAVGSIAPVSAGELSGVVGTSVTVRVRVLGQDERPLRRYEIFFQPSAGSGSVDPPEAQTDDAGEAVTTWTLGSTSGPQALSATAGGESLTFLATASPDVPATLVVESGGDAVGRVGETLTSSPLVRVLDRFGNGVPGVDVRLAVLSGGGGVASGTVTTDETGRASPVWTLGPSVGEQALGVEVEALEPALVRATAVAGGPAQISSISGDGQSGTVGQPLPDPLVVELRDSFGNLATGGQVEFVGEGSIRPMPAVADREGRASVQWTLGTAAGSQTAQARVGDALDSVRFMASAQPGPAAVIVALSGDGQTGWTGRSLRDSVAVRMEDVFGNPVPGVRVSFTGMSGGSALPPNVTSDALGEARSSWTLGAELGSHEILVDAEGATSTSFSATATSGPPDTIVVISGDFQTGPILTALPDSVVLRVLDREGRAVEAALLELLVPLAGNADPPALTTDSTGTAAFVWTVGVLKGRHELRIRADGAEARVVASVTVGPPTYAHKIGDVQSQQTGSAVPVQPAVIVTDAYGNPIPGVNVAFRVLEGGGYLGNTPRGGTTFRVTDANGRATPGGWVMGPVPGPQRMEADVDGIDPVVFTATAY